MKTTLKEMYEAAVKLVQDKDPGKWDTAEPMLLSILDTKDHTPSLFYLGCIHLRRENHGFAVIIFKEVLRRDPTFVQAYNNLAVIYKKQLKLDLAIQIVQEGIEALNKIKKSKDITDELYNELMADMYSNWGSLYVARGNPNKAIDLLNKSIKHEETSTAKWNRALAYLEKGDYKKGFSDYHEGDRYAIRKSKNYHKDKETPTWDGTKGQVVVVFGEQGIGDEIMFASILPDIMKDCKVILDAHPRLADMFRDAFPEIPVYGTRKENNPNWHGFHQIDACMPIGNLAKFYRHKKSDFPGTPYLHANPLLVNEVGDRVRKLGDKPKVGFSWTGGTKHTNHGERTIDLNLMKDMFALDCEFISLQYSQDSRIELDKFCEANDITVHHWQDVMDDYDLTAALLMNLDYFISVPQSVVHLAGALGVPGVQMCPVEILWQAGPYGQNMPWYSSIENIWQKTKGDWPGVLAEAKKKIEAFLDKDKTKCA